METPKHQEIKLVNEGAYGCIFSPGINCKGKKEQDGYLTKVQEKSYSLTNEITIGKQITTTIPIYEYYYSPIIQHCDLNLSYINQSEQSEIEKCKIIQQKTPTMFESTKIRNAGKQNIQEYLYNQSIEKTIETFSYLCMSIQKLQQTINIIHNDIKSNNIIYNEENHIPIIIDFGISYSYKDKTNLYNIFYTDYYYVYWCIEIYIVSFITQKIIPEEKLQNQTTEEEFISLSDEFIKKNFIDNTLLNNDEINQFKENYKRFYSMFLNQSWEYVLNQLWNTTDSYCMTWDYYSLAITYYIILLERLKTPPNIQPPNIQPPNNQLKNSFHDLLINIILCSPHERQSYIEKINVGTTEIPKS
jgi:serine/threonine protein kinase